MTIHTITLELPDDIFRQIQNAAERSKRPLKSLLTEAITASVPTLDNPKSIQKLRSSLAQMVYLNDAALWQAARATLADVTQQRLEELHDKQQRQKLTITERKEMESLETLYRDTLLVRAQAAFLLKQRDYDVSDPSQFSLVE
ncbi:MAG: hypothetical protein AAF614_15840 [Chloroflexota bacterium]